MESPPKRNDEIKSGNPFRRLYDTYGAGVAYISIIDKNGDERIGSCFHIGDGIFITARHVVEGVTIKEIGTTVVQRRYFEIEETHDTGFASVQLPYLPQCSQKFEGPFVHPNPNIDVAALVVQDVKAPILPLGDHLDDWLGDEYILADVVVFGYPPIPFSKRPLLISAKCEVNAIVDKYTGGHPHFILSTMARGGFSGGPAITEDGSVLGLITESLNSDYKPTELGYLSVLSVEGIYDCIKYHRIVPEHLDMQWDGFWNTESKWFSTSPSDHVSIDLYRGKEKFYFKIFSYRIDVIEKSLRIIDETISGYYSLTWIHHEMIKVEFKPGTIDEATASHICDSIDKMVTLLNIQKI